tara:strand:- start:1341 stop:2423 length:1083 start_codon:yes stop_codon:yes gene_type:complete
MKIKLLSIIGTRPQFIKSAAIARAAKNLKINHLIIDTGQHYTKSMSFSFVKELGLDRVDYCLKIGKKSSISQLSETMQKLEPLIQKIKPDFVIVYGDTNSTLAASIVCSRLKIRIAHVEAGQRSGNTEMQEEVNRILTDNISSILFTSTKESTQNLISENFNKKRIFQVGDVMFDSVEFFKKKIKKIYGDDYALLTIHRAENVDEKNRLKILVDGFIKLSKQIKIILPVHPRTKKNLIKYDFFSKLQNSLKILPPQPYLELLKLINGSNYVITDSGGIQKEAYFFKKRCFIVRDETEWNELVEKGFNKIIPPQKNTFYNLLLHEIKKNVKVYHDSKLFGDGKSSEKLLRIIKKEYEASHK